MIGFKKFLPTLSLLFALALLAAVILLAWLQRPFLLLTALVLLLASVRYVFMLRARPKEASALKGATESVISASAVMASIPKQLESSNPDELMNHAVTGPSVPAIALPPGLFQVLEEDQQGKKQVEQSLAIAKELLYQEGGLQLSHQPLQKVTVINQITRERKKVVLPYLCKNGVSLHASNEIVDEIQRLTGSNATIFQKFELGYLRVATNILKSDGSRALFTYIPNDSPIARKAAEGKTYRGSAFVVNDWYFSIYEPFYIDGALAGLIYVGVKEQLMPLTAEANGDERIQLLTDTVARFSDIKSLKFELLIGELIKIITLYSDPENVRIDPGLKRLVLLMSQACHIDTQDEEEEESAEVRLVNVLDFIDQHLNQDFSVEDLASLACMSLPNFFRLFKNAYNITPTQYVNQKRIEKACALLKKEEMSVTDVCFEVGYNNMSYFIKLFKNEKGLTPKQYQINHLKKDAQDA